MCAGMDKDVCVHCGREWTMDEEANPKDNDELVYCEGECKKWWHQKCHDPVIIPIPARKWYCNICSQGVLEESDEEEEEAVAPPPRRKARPAKKAPRVGERASVRMKESGSNVKGHCHKKKKKKWPIGVLWPILARAHRA